MLLLIHCDAGDLILFPHLSHQVLMLLFLFVLFYAVDMIRLSTMAVIFVMSLDDIYFYWSSVGDDIIILLHPVLVPPLVHHDYFRFDSIRFES